MKKYIIFLISTFLVLSYSCTNYEHGPSLSFKSASTRIAGEWELTDIIINDKTDEILLSDESKIKYTISEEGTIIANFIDNTRNSSSCIGNWQFNDDKSEIIVSFDSNSNPLLLHCNNYKILRMTDDELWISDELSEIKQCEYIIERRYTKIVE